MVRHHRGSTLGKDSARRLELIERNRVLLAVKLFPWSLLWLNPFYFAARLAAGLLAARRGDGRHRALSGDRREVAHGTRAACAAIWTALRLAPRMLRKRAEMRGCAGSRRARCGG